MSILSPISSLHDAIAKCKIIWEEEEVDSSDFININKKELVKLFNREEKRKALILHSDTTPIVLLSLLIGSLHSFISNYNLQESFLDFLCVGDKVIYENRLGEFIGKDSNGCFKVITMDRKKSPITNFIPSSSIHKLRPYFGLAQSLDGRGLRLKEDEKDTLLSSLFEISPNAIPRISRKSILIVCNREKADFYAKNIKLSMGNKKKLNISTVFPSAFYTTQEIYDYAGNPSRNNPVIKFASKLSVARSMIIDDEDIETLIVDGKDYILSNSMELDSIFDRSTLKTCLLIGEVQIGDYRELQKRFPDLLYYAWTQKAVEINIKDFQKEYISSSSLICRQYEFLKHSITQNISTTDVVSNMDFSAIKECKDNLLMLARSIDRDVRVKKFVVRSFSLLNLLERSIFPISVMEKMIDRKELSVLSPNESLLYLDSISHNYDDLIKENMQRVIQILKKLKNKLWLNNSKFNQLKKILLFNSDKKNKKAIIVAKKYYKDIVSKALPPGLRNNWENFDVLTPKKYNNSLRYDVVIFSGIFEGEILNPLGISNTEQIECLCYENDKEKLKWIEYITENKLEFYNHFNYLIPKIYHSTYSKKSNNKINGIIGNSTVADYSFERELERLVNSFSLEAYSVSSISEDPSQGIEIYKVASFENGEIAFLTKNYMAYIIDYSKRQVIEEIVDSLEVEDTLLFSSYDKEIKDLIDYKMKEVIEKEQGTLLESYQRSLYWKEVLKEYMKKNELSYKKLADKFKKVGSDKHEVTIRSWLEDKIYIVGPKDVKSFEAIALITGDQNMNEDYQAIYEACREIRSLRTRILKFIGSGVVKLYDSKLREEDEQMTSLFPESVMQHIKAIRIEKMIDANDLYVSPHLINKPLYL